MYPAHLGTGQTIDLDMAPPGGTPELLSTHEYVANRFNQQADDRLGPETNLYPLGFIDGWNLYEYVRSAPLSNTDPSGLGAAEKLCLQIVKHFRGNTCNALCAFCCHLKRHTGELGAKAGEVCLALHDFVCQGGNRHLTKALLRQACKELS